MALRSVFGWHICQNLCLEFLSSISNTIDNKMFLVIPLFVNVLQNCVKCEDDGHIGSQLAAEHFVRVLKVAKCDRPQPQVIYLSKLYPQINKKYIPFATVLFVCDTSTGCCSDEGHRCVARSAHKVTLHFLTLELTDRGNRKSVEAIRFDNHTQCQCKHINSQEKSDIYEEYRNRQNISIVSVNSLELHSNEPNLSENLKPSFISRIAAFFVMAFIYKTKRT